jgi:recombination protein RecT
VANAVIQREKVDTLRDLLARSKSQLAAALPRHLTPERMIRVAITAVQKTPELMECDPLSIVGSVMLASQLGLDLDSTLGHAYLVPFWNSKSGRLEAQMMVGYKGFLVLARRSGEISTFRPSIAYANETFQWVEGTDCKITHIPKLRDRGEPAAVYATIKLRDGGNDFEVIPWDEILKCQQEYGHYQQGKKKGQKKYGPWWDHLPEMAKKTAIRRLAKRCPMSVEMQRAVTVDELGEVGLSQGGVEELALTRTDVVAAKLGVIEEPAIVPEETDEDREERKAAEADAK